MSSNVTAVSYGVNLSLPEWSNCAVRWPERG